MAIDYVALKTEITTDPLAVGYLGKDDQVVADLLNDKAGKGASTLGSERVSGQDILEAIAWADLNVATTNQLLILMLLVILPNPLDLRKPNVRAILAGLFSGASATTKSQLTALATRACSRAEKLFGAGTAITFIDIAKARNA